MTKAVFLDRDGTINEDTFKPVRVPDFKFLPHAPQGLQILKDAGYQLRVVTNQAWIDKGELTHEELEDTHEHMQLQLRGQGCPQIDHITYCSHLKEAGCDCRKPGPGQYHLHTRQLHSKVFSRTECWMVGDKTTDMWFGKRLGIQTVLIRSTYWDATMIEDDPPTHVVDSLYEAAVKITES